MIKRLLALLLVFSLASSVCCAESTKPAESENPEFSGMNDPALLPYIEESLYDELVASLNSDDYLVESIDAVYISQEYLDELAFNSQTNVFFGYSIDELNEVFGKQRYAFTLSDSNETTVIPYIVTKQYDDTFERIVRNLAIGTGVILIEVTVCIVAAPLAPHVTMIMAYAAKGGMAWAVKGGAFSLLTTTAISYIQTGDIEYGLKQGLLGGSEGYKFGAIAGSLVEGGKETLGLFKAKMNGLTMKEAAQIQMDSKLPLDFIKNFHSPAEYEIYRKAGLACEKMGNTYTFTRPIDLTTKITDQYGKTMTNAERIMQQLSPVDPNGVPYELHHIGQQIDSPLAILTKAEHMQGGNNKILHFRDISNVEHGTAWKKEVTDYWAKYLLNHGG